MSVSLKSIEMQMNHVQYDSLNERIIGVRCESIRCFAVVCLCLCSPLAPSLLGLQLRRASRGFPRKHIVIYQILYLNILKYMLHRVTGDRSMADVCSCCRGISEVKTSSL